MRTFLCLLAAGLALSVGAAPASAQTNPHAGHGGPPSADAAPSTRAFKQAHVKMMRDMDIAYTGNADVDFVRGMIPHHQAAIDAARIVLQYGKDTENKKLATTIIAAQEKEIAEMKAWLAKNTK